MPLDIQRYVRNSQGRSDGGGYRYLYPPKWAQVNFLWGKMTSERLFNSFIHPQKLLYPPKKQISGYAAGNSWFYLAIKQLTWV